jgi:hypothetical protein
MQNIRPSTTHIIRSTLALVAAGQDHLSALKTELSWTQVVIKNTRAAIRASFDLKAEVDRVLSAPLLPRTERRRPHDLSGIS